MAHMINLKNMKSLLVLGLQPLTGEMGLHTGAESGWLLKCNQLSGTTQEPRLTLW